MAETKSKAKWIVIAGVLLVVLTATGAGLWFYQDAKLTEEAEAYAAQLADAASHTDVQIGLNVSHLAEVRQAHEAMAPAAEILENKADLFDTEQATAYVAAFDEVSAHAASSDPAMPTFAAPFNTDDFNEQSFVEHYRQANSQEREALQQQHAAILAQLSDLDAELSEAGAEMKIAVSSAHDTVTALLDSLPVTAETLTADLNEASDESITAVHTAAVFKAADPDNFSAVLGELTDHLIVYIEKIEFAQTNHEEAVKAREKAEKEAAEAAAAAQKSKSSNSSTRMCTRVSPGFGGAAMSLILVPCS